MFFYSLLREKSFILFILFIDQGTKFSFILKHQIYILGIQCEEGIYRSSQKWMMISCDNKFIFFIFIKIYSLMQSKKLFLLSVVQLPLLIFLLDAFFTFGNEQLADLREQCQKKQNTICWKCFWLKHSVPQILEHLMVSTFSFKSKQAIFQYSNQERKNIYSLKIAVWICMRMRSSLK